ncbi:hypothetical protein E2C01_086700 [Portunus trituberculatus]|uniref:Uncharacterized protein n=1 Tax=Portunus trituberculatus TaxID=210409 RepID=A0A5B7JFC3_PORTR|nr:hypothetical protein [Portunus trituberculatus]
MTSRSFPRDVTFPRLVYTQSRVLFVNCIVPPAVSSGVLECVCVRVVFSVQENQSICVALTEGVLLDVLWRVYQVTVL